MAKVVLLFFLFFTLLFVIIRMFKKNLCRIVLSDRNLSNHSRTLRRFTLVVKTKALFVVLSKESPRDSSLDSLVADELMKGIMKL